MATGYRDYDDLGVVGYVDRLGYLYCRGCADAQDRHIGDRVFADSCDRGDRCDFCQRTLEAVALEIR